MDAIDGISPTAVAQQVSTAGSAGAARAVGAAATDSDAFDAVLRRHLDAPRSDIASIRSEIASIRTGAALFERSAPPSDLEYTASGAMVSRAGFRSMPGWLDSQLASQATGDAADPYGWRSTSRQIAERVIGPDMARCSSARWIRSPGSRLTWSTVPACPRRVRRASLS